jgi:hypothetical protein
MIGTAIKDGIDIPKIKIEIEIYTNINLKIMRKERIEIIRTDTTTEGAMKKIPIT